MSLTVVHRKPQPARPPRRRPLDGFASHRLSLVAVNGQLLPRGRETQATAAREPGKRTGASITDIAVHRANKAGVSAPAANAAAGLFARWGERRMMVMAAATPPLVWLGHALVHWRHWF